MTPSDPRLRRLLRPARGSLGGVVASGAVSAALVIVQAWVVTGLVVAVVQDDPLSRWVLLTVAAFAARAKRSHSSGVAKPRIRTTARRLSSTARSDSFDSSRSPKSVQVPRSAIPIPMSCAAAT